MDVEVIFLGTAGSLPSARRAPSATLIRRGGHRILLDCGEGTQRQLLRSSLGLPDLDAILLSHFHADHVLGLPGLIKTFALRGREQELPVFGPPGIHALFAALAPLTGRTPFRLSPVEVAPGEAVEEDDYRLETVAADHGGLALCWALVEDERPGRFSVEAARALGVPDGPLFGALQRGETITVEGAEVRPEQVLGDPRPGRVLVFSGDSAPCDAVCEAARGAQLLVHEASFLDEDLERAVETRHATAGGAARLARAAGVSLLALTHLGQRAVPREIKRQARAVFEATVVPRDFDMVVVPLPERGEPELVRGGALGQAAAGAPEPGSAPEAEPAVAAKGAA